MMPYLTEKIPNIKYVIVGSPQSKKNEILNNINFLDKLSENEVIQFYNLIEVLAHSSKIGESFGYTIAESMAAGKPVVVNSTPLVDNAQIELVDNGITGFVANTPKDYANALIFLLKNKDKSKEMGQAGYEKVKKCYDARKLTKILEKLYIDILKEKQFEIESSIVKRYEKIEYFPSKDEIDNFEREYEKRLENCFGKMDLFYKLEVLSYKSFITEPKILSYSKEIIDIFKGVAR